MHTITHDGYLAEGPPRLEFPTLDLAALVYRPAWAALPSSLRVRFEAGHGPSTYVGTLACERSRLGAVFAWASRLLGAPLTAVRATALPVSVDVRPVPGGVAWSRQLGPGRWVRSVKSAGPNGTVLERTDGGLGMVLDVTAEGAALVFTSRSFFLAIGPWRLTVPGWLTPGRCRVEHRAVDDRRFRFTLTMTHPLYGVTFRQTGIFAEETLP